MPENKKPKTTEVDEDLIRKILEGNLVWPHSLDTGKTYRRTHDDNDGQLEQCVKVIISRDGDVHCAQDVSSQEEIDWGKSNSEDCPDIGVLFPINFLRFRHYFGGGNSPRVYMALIILALAIKLDNESSPIADPDAPR